MRHRVKKKTLGRKRNERKILIRNLANSLITKGRIKTTQAKAKILKTYIEKLITKSKKDDIINRRYLLKYLNSKAVNKLINEISPKYTGRKGGYTRVIKIKNRVGDNAPLVLIEFV